VPLHELPIPHLLGGVSQQPPAARLPGQVTEAENVILHVVNGLGKRKGSRHIRRLVTGLESVIQTHLISRDETERYQLLIGERRLRAFNADTGEEYPVKWNGTSTDVGRGAVGSGTPISYLNPRRAGGELTSDEDFVLGGGWLSAVGNSVVSYVAGRGPFGFGRFQSASAVTSDTVALVGNDAVSSISDIYQVAGLFSVYNVASVFVKKNATAINDVELMLLNDPFLTNYAGARFDISAGGVVTVGTTITTGSTVSAYVEDHGNGWYRCVIVVTASAGFPPPGWLAAGGARQFRIRFHTNAATPENKNALLFGARVHDSVQTAPSYLYTRPDLFRPLTAADNTFILNTEQTVGPVTGSSYDGLGHQKAIVFVKVGGQVDIPYTVVIRKAGGPDRLYSYTPGTTTTAETETIATQLSTAITAGAFFIASTPVGSAFQLVDGTEVFNDVTAHDGQGDTLLVAFRSDGGEVKDLTDLPVVLPDNADPVAKVIGDAVSVEDDYYVKFELEADNFYKGHWVECPAPGIPITLPGDTLPHRVRRLIDDAAGTITTIPGQVYFDVGPCPWDDRLVGDDTSNPAPSFIGEKIAEMFLYRGRLGFLTNDHVILSEAEEIFNLWRTTVRSLLDTDPIDISSGIQNSGKFRNVGLTADRCLIISERDQFELLAEPVLSPSTAQLAPVRAFENLPQVRPVGWDRGILFARQTGAFTGLLFASLVKDATVFSVEELTTACPRYHPGAGLRMAHSTLTNLTLIQTDADLSRLGVHQAFYATDESLLQSASFKWTFDAGASVLGIGFLGDDARLVVERSDGVHLEALSTTTELEEDNGLPIALLDRRLNETQVTAVYSGGPDETVLTLPYTISGTATMQVVDRASGLLVPIIAQTSNTITVSDDFSAAQLYIGERFDMRVVLSEPVVQEGREQGLVPRVGAPVDVHQLHLYLADTAILKCSVARDLRPTTTETFTAAGLGTGLLLSGTLGLYTGGASFFIIGNSKEIDCTLVNESPFPSFVQSGRWEIRYRARAATL